MTLLAADKPAGTAPRGLPNTAHLRDARLGKRLASSINTAMTSKVYDAALRGPTSLKDEQPQRSGEHFCRSGCQPRVRRHGRQAGCLGSRQDAVLRHAPRDVAQHQPRLPQQTGLSHQGFVNRVQCT